MGWKRKRAARERNLKRRYIEMSDGKPREAVRGEAENKTSEQQQVRGHF